MAFSVYTPSTPASGNPTNTRYIPELLKAVDTKVMLRKHAKKFRCPKNKGDNYTFLRAVTPAADVVESAEGVSKQSRSISFENQTGTLQEFSESFAWSSKQENMGETDIFAACKDRLKDLAAKTLELNCWYTIRNCTNVLYNASSITARNQVNGVAGKGRYDEALRLLDVNGADYHSEATKGSVNQNTTPLQPTMICVTHTDRKSDIEALPGFVPASQSPMAAASKDLMHWHGTVGQIMFLLTKELEPRLDAGATIAGTGMKGTTAVDVYTDVIFGKEAFGTMSLANSDDKEMGETQGMTFTYLDKADKSDRDNRLRILGVQWVDSVVILNQSWMIAIEQGVTASPN